MVENFEDFDNEIKDCSLCTLCLNRKNIIVGSGNKSAKVMFVGEGPGNDEDAQGSIFIGKSGILMDYALKGVGIDKNEVYFTNVVKCHAPENRNYSQEEINSCLKYLRAEVKLVNPEIVVLLGNVALKSILGKEYSITSARGKWLELNGIKFISTFHPAALLRDESKKISFWEDLLEIKKYM